MSRVGGYRRGHHWRRDEVVLTLELLNRVAELAADKGATDLVALHVAGVTPFSDYLLFVTAGSERHVNSIADHVSDTLALDGVKTRVREGGAGARWVLLDLGDVVLHVFHEDERAYYSLERLWGDCPVVPLAVNASQRLLA